MKLFICGGAVRDVLLGQTPKDLDFVVVGSSEDEMLNLGYKQVGADFPVFLHPSTGHEYALARQERKSGNGYCEFDTITDNVTLEEDLLRRDLTVNALAVREQDWEHFVETRDPSFVIDYHSGLDDIANNILRHVSIAFSEDSVRALRIARFCARWGDEWTVHESTVALIKEMHSNGELDNLTRERVWKELSRAIMEPHAHLFFVRLKEWGILPTVLGGKLSGPIATQEFWNFDFAKLKEAARLELPLAVRLPFAGLNSIDLERIKCDSDIVNFVSRLYNAMMYVDDIQDGKDVVLALNALNAYQNEKNRNWFIQSVNVLIGPQIGALFLLWWDVSKDVKFDSLSDDQKADRPAMYSTHINNNRAATINEFCETAIDKIREQFPKAKEVIEGIASK